MLDDVDKRILELLSNDGRMSVKDLAQHVGLSAPSTSERIKRLEERGVIRGFTVEIDPASIGFMLQAIIRVRPLPGKLHVVQQLIEAIPEISECDKVTGDDASLPAACPLDRGAGHHPRSDADKAETNTSIVKLQPVKRRLLPLS